MYSVSHKVKVDRDEWVFVILWWLVVRLLVLWIYSVYFFCIGLYGKRGKLQVFFDFVVFYNFYYMPISSSTFSSATVASNQTFRTIYTEKIGAK